jgi:hypothetical protein
VPKTRKLSCSFQEKENYILKILSKLDISTIEVYMARKHSPQIPKEHFRPAQAAAVILNQNGRCAGKFVQGLCGLCGARYQTDRKFKFILFYFPSQGLIGVKACILNPGTFVL